MPVNTIQRPPSVYLEDDKARARRDDHTTSHEAADSNDPAASRRFVMFALIEHGLLAQFELERIAEGLWSPSRVRTAVSELVERGLVEFTGIYRVTPSGRRAQVWAVASVDQSRSEVEDQQAARAASVAAAERVKVAALLAARTGDFQDTAEALGIDGVRA